MAFGITFHSDSGFIFRFEHDCYYKKKERGNNKATVVPKNLTDRERHTDRQRQKKKEGDKERVWQTKTDCYIGHERTSSKKSTKNQSQRICSKIMRRGLRLVRNGKFLRNVTWPWRRKLVKKHRSSNVFWENWRKTKNMQNQHKTEIHFSYI